MVNLGGSSAGSGHHRGGGFRRVGNVHISTTYAAAGRPGFACAQLSAHNRYTLDRGNSNSAAAHAHATTSDG